MPFIHSPTASTIAPITFAIAPTNSGILSANIFNNLIIKSSIKFTIFGAY